jgi:hypothetical protein
MAEKKRGKRTKSEGNFQAQEEAQSRRANQAAVRTGRQAPDRPIGGSGEPPIVK